MISRSIDAMYDRYGSSLSVRDLADVAALSPFYFTRKFRQATGVPPGDYLAAIRVAKAKSLLLTTRLRVSDIMFRVGYGSIGTFTRRFTASVGMPPTRYRSLAGAAPDVPTRPVTGVAGALSGSLAVETGFPLRTVVVGAFDGPVARGRPRQMTVLPAPGPWSLAGLEPGSYYVIAVAAPDCWDQGSRAVPIRDPAAVGSAGPVEVRPGSTRSVPLRLAPWFPIRVPVLYPIPCVTAPCLGAHR